MWLTCVKNKLQLQYSYRFNKNKYIQIYENQELSWGMGGDGDMEILEKKSF